MVTKVLFVVLLLLLAVQRLAEVRKSRMNEAAILSQGGREHAPGHYRVMQVLHVAWFVSVLVEVLVVGRPFVPALAAAALTTLLVGQALRYAAIRSLGPRWTVRIMTLPDAAPVTDGVYRYIRHPNYLGVVMEIFTVPLIHTAYLTAVLFSLANAGLLFVRIRAEERALQDAGSHSLELEGRPRFIPRF
jgi:methyltransferase